ERVAAVRAAAPDTRLIVDANEGWSPEMVEPFSEKLGALGVEMIEQPLPAAQDAILADLAQGRTDLAVGTHALFTEDVAFKDLALAVVDEQHRFGVHQRLAITAKGRKCDALVMTAT
ncbi:MAG TPA: hypothetical protein DCL95_08755, partial [Rhodospirillaceae bacterium]|nr:hypothetical protein [Rhodospirillaceae bacterium]